MMRVPLRAPSGRDGVDGDGSTPTAGEPVKRVLLVDDNTDACDSLAELLRECGHDVRVAHDGSAALRDAPGFQPDVIVLDIGLPGMDGYEVARRLRGEPRLSGAILVALTGYGEERHRRRAEESGFDHHMTKPVDLEKLTALLGTPELSRAN
jgi:CheY-like chemotaxis protein